MNWLPQFLIDLLTERFPLTLCLFSTFFFPVDQSDRMPVLKLMENHPKCYSSENNFFIFTTEE